MTKQRYNLIDSLRGFAVINMVVYHLCYDIFVIFGANRGWVNYPFTFIWERFISISFILIAGISLNFSKNPIKRGIVVNLFGLLITAVTLIFIPSEAIWFGVLNFIGCAMLICGAFRVLLDRVHPTVGFTLSALLYTVFYSVSRGSIGFFDLEIIKLPDILYQTNLLTIFGFPPKSFVSSDYFPLLPWIFVFTAGYFLWKIIQSGNAEGLFVQGISILNWNGKNSMWIYLAHQPICFGIVYLFNLIF